MYIQTNVYTNRKQMGTKNQKLPQFALIKQFLEQQIKSGQWPPGTRIPTEQSLTDTFSVSRMTARRAVKELADVGLLTRTPGKGTYVSSQEPDKPVFKIEDVIAKIQAAGTYSHRLLSMDSVQATTEIAKLMQIQTNSMIFQLTVVHLNQDRPIQWQNLSVNCSFAPALLKQKFAKITPDAYLDWLCPSNKSEYQLKAVTPSASQRLALALNGQESAVCMQLSKRQWLGGDVVSFSTYLHPADDYYLGTDFGQ
jgi:GntR family histidine utilization transcriptional repressor